MVVRATDDTNTDQTEDPEEKTKSVTSGPEKVALASLAKERKLLAEASEEISPRLDRRSYNLLRGQGISTLGDLVGQSRASLMKIEGFGPKTLEKTTGWLRTEHSIVLPDL